MSESVSSKLSAASSGVFDHVTNAWFVADNCVSGTLSVVFVWLISPHCTRTPAEYSMTDHWTFIVEISVVTRTNSTLLEFTSRPRIIEPPGALLLWRELKIKNEFVGFTPAP